MPPKVQHHTAAMPPRVQQEQRGGRRRGEAGRGRGDSSPPAQVGGLGGGAREVGEQGQQQGEEEGRERRWARIYNTPGTLAAPDDDWDIDEMAANRAEWEQDQMLHGDDSSSDGGVWLDAGDGQSNACGEEMPYFSLESAEPESAAPKPSPAPAQDNSVVRASHAAAPMAAPQSPAQGTTELTEAMAGSTLVPGPDAARDDQPQSAREALPMPQVSVEPSLPENVGYCHHAEWKSNCSHCVFVDAEEEYKEKQAKLDDLDRQQKTIYDAVGSGDATPEDQAIYQEVQERFLDTQKRVDLAGGRMKRLKKRRDEDLERSRAEPHVWSGPAPKRDDISVTFVHARGAPSSGPRPPLLDREAIPASADYVLEIPDGHSLLTAHMKGRGGFDPLKALGPQKGPAMMAYGSTYRTGALGTPRLTMETKVKGRRNAVEEYDSDDEGADNGADAAIETRPLFQPNEAEPPTEATLRKQQAPKYGTETPRLPYDQQLELLQSGRIADPFSLSVIYANHSSMPEDMANKDNANSAQQATHFTVRLRTFGGFTSWLHEALEKAGSDAKFNQLVEEAKAQGPTTGQISKALKRWDKEQKQDYVPLVNAGKPSPRDHFTSTEFPETFANSPLEKDVNDGRQWRNDTKGEISFVAWKKRTGRD